MNKEASGQHASPAQVPQLISCRVLVAQRRGVLHRQDDLGLLRASCAHAVARRRDLRRVDALVAHESVGTLRRCAILTDRLRQRRSEVLPNIRRNHHQPLRQARVSQLTTAKEILCPLLHVGADDHLALRQGANTFGADGAT